MTTGNQSSEGMDVSPDGRWLAFDSTRSGNQHIFKMPLPSGEPVQLTKDSPSDCCPTWSPDGTRIAFHSFRTGNRDIFVMSADGGSLRQITRHPGPDKYPRWSPDGKQIVFYSERHAPEGRLFIVSADEGEMQGEEAKPFIEAAQRRHGLPTVDGSPALRPASDNLALFAPDGREIRTLAPGFGYPRWSSDGRTVYYRKMRDIWRVAVSGGKPELLVRFDEPERPASRSEWASDGKRFYFTLTEYEGDVWVMELQ